MEKPSLEEEKTYTKTLFAPKRHLPMVVSGRVLERRYQGLSESGPKNCTLNLKMLANYVQRYLKIHNFHL